MDKLKTLIQVVAVLGLIIGAFIVGGLLNEPEVIEREPSTLEVVEPVSTVNSLHGTTQVTPADTYDPQATIKQEFIR